jgi:glyoxylase-like metal-dependent hydrolase (beta-lactamase superfamily II)
MADDAWEEVGEGVYRKRYQPLDVTVTAVVGSDGVAVVDTRCSLAEGREIKEDLRRLTSAPVRWVVNTHAHFDHCWGNAEFAAPRLTPPAQIWGHETLPPRIDPADPGVVEMRALLATKGSPWAEKEAELELVPPTELVRDAAVLDLGDRALDLRYLGRGHTDGDLWILVSGTGVALAGDLIEESGPPMFGEDSFPLEWAGTLERGLGLLAPGAVIVPGHGAVVDATFVRAQRDAIDAVAQEIRRLHAAEVPVSSAGAEGTWALPSSSLGSAITRGYTALDS